MCVCVHVCGMYIHGEGVHIHVLVFMLIHVCSCSCMQECFLFTYETVHMCVFIFILMWGMSMFMCEDAHIHRNEIVFIFMWGLFIFMSVQVACVYVGMCVYTCMLMEVKGLP